MANVNYLLLYQSNTDKGGHEARVRGFAKLESAIAAMNTAYGSIAAELNLPPNDTRYTIRTEKRIRLERYGEVFCPRGQPAYHCRPSVQSKAVCGNH